MVATRARPRGHGGLTDFDLRALHVALDAERRARLLSWAALSRAIAGGRISASSFSGLASRGAANGNVVMAALRWLDRTPETSSPTILMPRRSHDSPATSLARSTAGGDCASCTTPSTTVAEHTA